MIHNNQKPAQSWSPTDRRLWLAKHGAPDNFVLLTALEIAAIENGLKAEHAKAIALQQEANRLADANKVLIKIADRLLTDLENVVQGLDPEEAAQVKAMRDAINAIPPST